MELELELKLELKLELAKLVHSGIQNVKVRNYQFVSQIYRNIGIPYDRLDH